MTYTRRYNVRMAVNPTTPGVNTMVEQSFDGSCLTDRYITQLCNGLRRYGVLPRYGGMYQLAAMLARALQVQMPYGWAARRWMGNSFQVFAWEAKDATHKKHFVEMQKLSIVRHEMQQASGADLDVWSRQYNYADWDEHYGLLFPGWTPKESIEFRKELKTRALAHIPSYLEDMEKIAAFLETRPKFTLMTATPLKTVKATAGGVTLTT